MSQWRSAITLALLALPVGKSVTVADSQPGMQRRLYDLRHYHRWHRAFTVKSMAGYRNKPVKVTRVA